MLPSADAFRGVPDPPPPSGSGPLTRPRVGFPADVGSRRPTVSPFGPFSGDLGTFRAVEVELYRPTGERANLGRFQAVWKSPTNATAGNHSPALILRGRDVERRGLFAGVPSP